jgi:hypothetical protein
MNANRNVISTACRNTSPSGGTPIAGSNILLAGIVFNALLASPTLSFSSAPDESDETPPRLHFGLDTCASRLSGSPLIQYP